MITSGSNGYTANAGYNLVTGLGTPVANLLVPDLVAYQGPGTTYAGPTVGALQDATLVDTGSSGGGTTDVFNVFSAITVSSGGVGYGQGPGCRQHHQHAGERDAGAAGVVASHAVVTPVATVGTTPGWRPAPSSQTGLTAALGTQTNSSPLGLAAQPPAGVTITSVVHRVRSARTPAGPTAQAHGERSARFRSSRARCPERIWRFSKSSFRSQSSDGPRVRLGPGRAGRRLGPVAGARGNGTITIPVLPTDRVIRDPFIGDPLPQRDQTLPPADYAAGLAVLGLAAGFWARGTGLMDARKRQSGRLFFRRKMS